MAGSHQCIPQIRLSSGTIVNIPVFRYHSGMEFESKMGGIFKAYKEKNGTRTEVQSSALLSDSDFLELMSLLGDYSYTGISQGSYISTTESYNLYGGFWLEDSNGDFYYYGTAAGRNSHSINISLGSRIWADAPVSDTSVINRWNTYNDVGITGQNYSFTQLPYETHSFMEMCNHYDSTTPDRSEILNASITSSHVQIDGFYEGNHLYEFVWAFNGYVHSHSSYDDIYANITAYATAQHLDIGINTYDSDNPYSFEPATFGGGNGSMGSFNPDGVDPAEVPSLPQLSASDIGFMSIYNPGTSQLKQLSAFLWSSAFDVDSFKKLFSDPMQCIIGLGIVPVQPTIGGSKNVTFGDIDSGVSMSYISSEWVEKDMGAVTIDLLYGSFMDYNSTKISIYLPYIGFRDLAASDIIGGSIGVKYHINVLDGGCTAYITHSSRGVLYQYSGSCIANVPLSSINYSGALQNAISAALSGATVAVGAATGAAPVTALGAMGLVSNAANLAMNSKPSVQRSGTTSGSSGLMAIQRPYIIIERANISVPDRMNNFVGNTTNVTMTISSCSGFTIIDQIHLDNVICTENEREELMSLLKKGVIF